MHGIVNNIDSIHSLNKTWHGLETLENSISYENSGWNFQIERVKLKDWSLKTVKEIIIDKENNLVERPVCGHFISSEVNGKTERYLLTTTTGESYPLIQPKEIYDSIQILLDEFGFKISCSGTIYGRKRMFLNLESDESAFSIGENDVIRPSLRVVAGNDKGVSPSWFTGATRIVCMNTFNASLSELHKILKHEAGENQFAERIRHSKNFSAKLVEVKHALTDFYAGIELLKESMTTLSAKPISKDDAYKVIIGSIANGSVTTRAINVADDILARFESGIGNCGTSRYDLLNGFTERYTRANSDDNAKGFISSEFGSSATKKEAFFLNLLSDEKIEALAKRGEKLLAERKDEPETVLIESV